MNAVEQARQAMEAMVNLGASHPDVFAAEIEKVDAALRAALDRLSRVQVVEVRVAAYGTHHPHLPDEEHFAELRYPDKRGAPRLWPRPPAPGADR